MKSNELPKWARQRSIPILVRLHTGEILSVEKYKAARVKAIPEDASGQYQEHPHGEKAVILDVKPSV